MDKIGDRVKLVFCSDPYTKIPSGTLGTIQIIDSLGTIHVKWDNGAHLGLVPGEDQWVKVEQ